MRLQIDLIQPEDRYRFHTWPAFSINQRLKKFCLHTAMIAVSSLHAELVLFPKPGLVSPYDCGSHNDMNAGLFMRSLFALRHYFRRMVYAGAMAAPFAVLKEMGMQAEQRMLAATGGINTHRGAIFSLGLMCAASGRCHNEARPLTSESIHAAIMANWGDELLKHCTPVVASTHGIFASKLHGISGARDEAARGFPSVFSVALPQIYKSLARGGSPTEAQVDALFSLMATMTDTNIYHRGGKAGASFAREEAQRFIEQGGTLSSTWRETALECHRRFVIQRLSPGGAADLLAASWFVYRMIEDTEKL